MSNAAIVRVNPPTRLLLGPGPGMPHPRVMNALAAPTLGHLDPVLIGIVVFSWMPIARLVNTMVITVKSLEFVQAAHSIGGSPLWILRKHLIPNSLGPAIVLATRDVGSAVILQATITFIGLGGGAPWGVILSIGRNWVIGARGNLLQSWWIYLPATIVVILFGVGWNLLGDGLQSALEPHRQQ